VVELLAAAGTALWLGVLTSISPCPMATNVAAVSYIGRTVMAPGRVVWTGVLYAAGRMLAYVAVGALLVFSLLSAPVLSHALQKYMIRALGPLLAVAGVLLLEWVPLRLPQFSIGVGMQERLGRWGAAGGALLGFLFALTFCPISAAIFFGSLLPLALEVRSSILLPSLYGLGTALPVVAFAVLLATSAGAVGRTFDRIGRIEKVARLATAIVFLAVGGWFTLKYTFGVI
jgi:cytochrome c biogenesis protein CcdA